MQMATCITADDWPIRDASTGGSGALSTPMPTIARLLFVLLVLTGAVAGTVFALGTFVEPEPREITVRLRMDGFGR